MPWTLSFTVSRRIKKCLVQWSSAIFSKYEFFISYTALFKESNWNLITNCGIIIVGHISYSWIANFNPMVNSYIIVYLSANIFATYLEPVISKSPESICAFAAVGSVWKLNIDPTIRRVYDIASHFFSLLVASNPAKLIILIVIIIISLTFEVSIVIISSGHVMRLRWRCCLIM